MFVNVLVCESLSASLAEYVNLRVEYDVNFLVLKFVYVWVCELVSISYKMCQRVLVIERVLVASGERVIS